MLGNKHTFWEALIIALVIFWTGILLGVFFENYRTGSIERLYYDSQTDVADFESAVTFLSSKDISCQKLNERGVFFADKIYENAAKLEKYDNSNKITTELVHLHRRYDLLRTTLWKNLIDNSERCKEEVDIVVYLYNYQNPSIETKATQGAMSNYLTDLKIEYGDSIVLIPIAADTDITSLDILRERYNLDTIPVIFVNQEHKFEDLDSLEEIRGSL